MDFESRRRFEILEASHKTVYCRWFFPVNKMNEGDEQWLRTQAISFIPILLFPQDRGTRTVRA
jgi:hypothetical protein